MTRETEPLPRDGEAPAASGEASAVADASSPKVAQILDAARDLFLDLPYGSVSTDAIARRAGVSKATLYVYFPSKEVLFETLVRSQCRTIGCDIRRAAGEGAGEGVEATLRRIAHDFLDMLASPEALSLYRTIVAQVPQFPELGRVFYEAGPDSLVGRVADFLELASRRGEIELSDARLSAIQFLHLVSADIPMITLLGLPAVSPAKVERTVEGGIAVFMAAHAPKSAPA